MKKQILLPFVLLGSLGMVAALAGCTPSGEKGYGVEITNKDALQETWYAGSSRDIEINLTPAGNVMAELTTGALKIESSNPSVVSITGAVANALDEGSAKVTVKYHGWKDTVDLTIDHKQTIQEKYGVAHAGTSADPLTNEEAIAITNHEAYADGQEDLYVGGTVASFYHAPGSRTDGAVSWFLEPAQGQTEKFEIYKCYKEGTGTASYLTNQDVWKGGYAVAHGRFTKYGDQCETSSAIYDRCDGEPPVDPVTIQSTFAEALAAGKALDDGDSTYDYYQFDAYVTKQSGSNYFLTATKAEEITDEKANTIEIYGASADVAAKTLKNAKVTVKMIIKNYHGQVENGVALTADDVTVVEAGEQWVIPEHTVTVAQGLEVINGLADGATTSDLYNFSEVYVKAVTDAYNAEYGNMSFTIADTADGTDTITVFRAKTDATTAAKVVAGAQVTVKGNLQKYVKNETMTPELLNVASITVKDGGDVPPAPSYNIVDNPVAGTKYKLGMKISAASDKTADVYSTGAKDGNYGATTEDASQAADFELVAVTGGYNVKVTLPDNSVKYLNGVVSGDYTNISFDAAASTVFTYDTAAKTLFFTANGHTTATKDGVYYFGTYTSKGSTYTTISCSMASYIQGDNASKIDVSQFPVHFWAEGEGGGGGEQTGPQDVADVNAVATVKTVAEVKAYTAADNTLIAKVTGVAENLYSAQYGNFYVTDPSTGASVIVYGGYTDATFQVQDGAYSTKTKTTVVTSAIIGKEVTVYATVGAYHEVGQLVDALVVPGNAYAGTVNASVTVNDADFGTATLSSATAAYGSTINVTVTPASGYTVQSVVVNRATGKAEVLTENAGVYPFAAEIGNSVVVTFIAVPTGLVTDNLTISVFGASGTSYKDYTSNNTVTGTYAAQMAAGNDSLQIRSSNSNSGIIGTCIGLKAKTITITFNSSTTNGRTVDIYASNTEFAITGMYGSGPTKVGSLSYDGTTATVTYTFTADYTYIGLRSNNGALYMSSVAIGWQA